MDWLRRRKDDNRTLDQFMKHEVPDAKCHIYATHQKDFVLRCSNWKTPPLEKTLPFTGAQNVCLQISNSEGGAQKNGYYHSLPYGKMYVPDLKPMCDLDLKTVLFEIKNPYRSTKNPYRRSVRL